MVLIFMANGKGLFDAIPSDEGMIALSSFHLQCLGFSICSHFCFSVWSSITIKDTTKQGGATKLSAH